MVTETNYATLRPITGEEYYDRLTSSLQSEADAALAAGRPDLHAKLLLRAEAMRADADRLFAGPRDALTTLRYDG